MSIWSTKSVRTVENAAEDPNPELWVEAAKKATSYEDAMLFIRKAKYYDKDKKIDEIHDGTLQEELACKFLPRVRSWVILRKISLGILSFSISFFGVVIFYGKFGFMLDDFDAFSKRYIFTSNDSFCILAILFAPIVYALIESYRRTNKYLNGKN